jgi:hypothetical protein
VCAVFLTDPVFSFRATLATSNDFTAQIRFLKQGWATIFYSLVQASVEQHQKLGFAEFSTIHQ